MKFILIIFLLLIISPKAQAQIIINEVFPAPKQGDEWVELYNISNQDIDLSGWLLEDQLSSPSLIAPIENQVILSQDFLTIELLSAKLNNSADGVVLRNYRGEIADQMSYSRSESELSWSKNNAGIFELTPPTKNTTNVFPSPSPSPTSSPSPSPSPSPTPNPSPTDTSFHHHITISEFLACPIAGEQEWIKLYNADDQPHLISGWKIRDLSNQTRHINTTLAAKGYQIISWSGSLLNNSGDEFYLRNELGENWQHIKYDACQHNNSYINIDQSWVEKITTITTKKETKNKIGSTSVPTNSSLVVTLTTPTPPTSPSPPRLPQQLILNHDLITTPRQTKLVNIINRKPPRVSLLSVILGGSWLLFSSSWKINEKISQQNSAS